MSANGSGRAVKRGADERELIPPKKPGPGKRPGLTKGVMKKFIAALEAGGYLQDAADYAGIGRSTANLWMAKGRAGEAGYVDFVEAVERAQAGAIAKDLEAIAKAAKDGDWRAAAWRLEHRHPTKFGPHLNVRTQVERELEEFLARAKETLSPEEYEKLAAAYLAKGEGG